MAEETIRRILSEIKENAGRFYVYVLERPTGEPFYVGCGRAVGGKAKARILDHERAARRGEKSLKSSTIRKIWQSGLSVGHRTDSWHETVDCMFAREVELISLFGRRDTGAGILANGNDGGTGQMNPSEEIRASMSVGIRSRWTAERRAEQRARMLAQLASDGQMREANRAALAEYWTPERRASYAQDCKERFNSPEEKERARRITVAYFAIPENRKAHAERAKERGADPELKKKVSESIKLLWNNQEYRDAQRASRLGRKTSDVTKLRQSEARKRYLNGLGK